VTTAVKGGLVKAAKGAAIGGVTTLAKVAFASEYFQSAITVGLSVSNPLIVPFIVIIACTSVGYFFYKYSTKGKKPVSEKEIRTNLNDIIQRAVNAFKKFLLIKGL
jgi:hypothetical protein